MPKQLRLSASCSPAACSNRRAIRQKPRAAYHVTSSCQRTRSSPMEEEITPPNKSITHAEIPVGGTTALLVSGLFMPCPDDSPTSKRRR